MTDVDFATDNVMTVVRVHTERGSHIEPPLREDWDDVTKLRWKAAVVTADTYLRVLVHPMEHRGRPVYSIQVGATSCGAVPFHDAWCAMSDIALGAREAIALYEPGPDAARWTPDTREEAT